MPRSPPANLSRSFKTRTDGIFKKASELHDLDDSIRITITIERPGQRPMIFSTERQAVWPCDSLEEYIREREAVLKRPAHFQSLEHGLSKGHVRMVERRCSSPLVVNNRPSTPESTSQSDSYQTDSTESFFLSSPPFMQHHSRTASPLPSAEDMVLPSERKLRTRTQLG